MEEKKDENENENENDEKISQNKGKSNKKIEIKEIRLGKMSPGFNLVSLKARNRLNIFKQLFSKSEYRDYFRKCKNMYSISSLMNKKFSMNDLYRNEKSNINDIISIYNKIDSKLDSQKIKVINIKKNKINKILNNKSLSATNFYKNKIDFENSKSNNSLLNIIQVMGSTNNGFANNSINQINSNENSIINVNNNNKIFRSFNENQNNANNLLINQMTKTTYPNKNNKLFNYKRQLSFRKNYSTNDLLKIKNKGIIYSSSPPTFYNLKHSKVLINNKKGSNSKAESNKNNDYEGIYFFQTKQHPKSCINNCFTITQFGGLIHQNSLLRSKKIVDFVPNNSDLPLIYKNFKIK